MSIESLIPYVQIALSVLLVGGVLLQRSEAGLGGAFGGDSFSSGHHTKRGGEKVIFIATIVIAVLFVATSFTLLRLK
jgi:protein translocase SecG subunit